jgi:hypothetical protein
MSIKSKVLASAATLALVGGVGTAGAANATTPSCGSNCDTIYSQEFGDQLVLDVYQQQARINQPIILLRASNGDPAEDFRITDQGSVDELYEAGLLTSKALLLHYGCDPAQIASSHYQAFGCPVNANVNPGTDPLTNQCSPAAKGCTTGNDEPAFEIQYTPNGQYSGLCVGVAKAAFQEEGVTLQECGASANTFWVLATNDQPFSRWGDGNGNDNGWNGYDHGRFDFPLINGSDTNYSQPFVLTSPQSSTGKPRPQLQVQNLTGYTDGEFPFFTNFDTVPDDQMWGVHFFSP